MKGFKQQKIKTILKEICCQCLHSTCNAFLVTLKAFIGFKEVFVAHQIFISLAKTLIDCNWTRTQNHLVLKRTLSLANV